MQSHSIREFVTAAVRIAVFFAFANCSELALSAPQKEADVPITEQSMDGKSMSVDDGKLFGFESSARERIAREGGPDEMFLLAWSPSSLTLEEPAKVMYPQGLLVLELSKNKGLVRFHADYGKKQSESVLSHDESRRFADLMAKNNFDALPKLEATRTIRGKEVVIASGRIYVYLHIVAKKGHRIFINNPPTKDDAGLYPPDDSLWKYNRLIETFITLKPKEKKAE